MSKPFDYYAGYPSQQRTPKWVGVTLGSIFGGLSLIALVVGIRLVVPAHKAEASVVPVKAQDSANAQPLLAAAKPADEVAPARTEAPRVRSAKHHGKQGRIALASAKPQKSGVKYKKAQMFAKHVSSSRRDKHSRDEIDRMLGL